MASCGSTWCLPHLNVIKSTLRAAVRALDKTSFGDVCMQQMPRQPLQRAQQRAQQPQLRQDTLQRRRRKKECLQNEEAEGERQLKGQQFFSTNSQNESVKSASVSDCDSSYFEGVAAVARHLRLRYTCSLLLFVVLQGSLVAFCGEAASAVTLAMEERESLSPPVLATLLEEESDAEKEAYSEAEPLLAEEVGRNSLPPFRSSSFSRKVESLHASTIVKSEEAYEFAWNGSRILALGDLHGDLLNCLLLLCATGLVDPVTHSWRGGTALLIQTGDINDRGPQGVAVLDFLARLSIEARAAGGGVLQLMGNHDVMNVCGDFRYAHAAETEQLGGALGRRAAFHVTHGRYGRMVFSFLAAAKVNGVVFSHAGVLHDFAEWGLPALTSRLRGELANDCELSKKASTDVASGARGSARAAVTGVDGPLWTRSFSMGPLVKICEEVDQTLHVLQAQKMVIGHTVQESGHIETYCRGRLIAIDTGISRYVSNQPKILEIKEGNFFEWGVPPPQPGESVRALLMTAAQTAVVRPLDIPPLKKVTPSSTAEKSTTTERAQERPQILEGVEIRSDEL